MYFNYKTFENILPAVIIKVVKLPPPNILITIMMKVFPFMLVDIAAVKPIIAWYTLVFISVHLDLPLFIKWYTSFILCRYPPKSTD